MPRAIYIDSFEAVDGVRQRMGYQAFRAAVLKAGRFSVFEATETAWKARMFDTLVADPTIETDISCGYPWTIVREKQRPEPQPCRRGAGPLHVPRAGRARRQADHPPPAPAARRGLGAWLQPRQGQVHRPTPGAD